MNSQQSDALDTTATPDPNLQSQDLAGTRRLSKGRRYIGPSETAEGKTFEPAGEIVVTNEEYAVVQRKIESMPKEVREKILEQASGMQFEGMPNQYPAPEAMERDSPLHHLIEQGLVPAYDPGSRPVFVPVDETTTAILADLDSTRIMDELQSMVGNAIAMGIPTGDMPDGDF